MQQTWTAHLLISLSLACGLLLHGCGGGGGSTPAPTPPPTPAPTLPPTPPPKPTCLCVFDIDRTLTGRQGQIATCTNDQEFKDIPDKAYAGGSLIVSEGLLKLNQTFCHACYLGIVSAGIASGVDSPERNMIHALLQQGGQFDVNPNEAWNDYGCAPNVPITRPLVTECPDETKQLSIPGIVKFYADKFGNTIADEKVYFFDDRHINIDPFDAYQSTHKYNAKQISCATRDSSAKGATGNCGATLAELKEPQTGVSKCVPPTTPQDEEAVAV